MNFIFLLKNRIIFSILLIRLNLGYEVQDVGTDSYDSVDYPKFGHDVANLVVDGGWTSW